MTSTSRLGATMDQRAIERWRMYTLRLSGQTHDSPESVVAGLLGVEAENDPQASWAVATRRVPASSPPLTRKALAERR